MKLRLKITLAVVAIISGATYAQGPWTKEKGKGYVQLGASAISYDHINIDTKTQKSENEFKDITTQLYAEYGITNKLEIQFIVPFKILSYKSTITNSTENLSGIGNITTGLKYKLSDAKWKISSGILFSGNSIQKDDVIGLRTGFDASTILPYLTIGSSCGKWYYYANTGYGYMSNNYSDYLKIGAEVGYNIIPKAHLIAVLDTRNVVAKENFYTTDNPNYFKTATYLDRQQYTAYGLKINYEFKKDKIGANLAAFSAFTLSNIPAAPSLNASIYAKF